MSESAKPEVKISKTYRLPAATIELVRELSEFFKESGAQTIERAINLLDRERALEVKFEHDQRLNKIGPAK